MDPKTMDLHDLLAEMGQREVELEQITRRLADNAAERTRLLGMQTETTTRRRALAVALSAKLATIQ